MRAFVLGSMLLLSTATSGHYLGHALSHVGEYSYLPADTPEVFAAKAAHFAAHAAVKTGHGLVDAPNAVHHQHWDHAPAQKTWHGPIHIPVIHKGVPVEPKEVLHAKAEHAAAYAKVQGHHHAPQEHYGHHEEAKAYGTWHGPQHVPVIHNGVPVETPEVQHAKAAHLNALVSAGAHSGYDATPAWGHGSEDDGSYDPTKYERTDY